MPEEQRGTAAAGPVGAGRGYRGQGLLGRLLDDGERVLESFAARLFLSFLIILSVLPDRALGQLLPARWAEHLPAFFLAVFVPELFLRTAVYLRRLYRGDVRGWEPLFLTLDFVAVVSFLPVQHLFPELAYLRLFRLTRMLLLLGYWGGTVRELWAILTAREWRYQVVVVLTVGALLAFGAAVLLTTLGAQFDFDENGVVDREDRTFSAVLWWSFLQVEDPGNLVREPRDLLVLAASLSLTLAGVLLFSFLVGIGTSAVEELMARAREKPVDLSGHSVVLGVGPYSHLLLSELAELYGKNRRRFRAAVQGTDLHPPDFLHRRSFRGVRYRHGDPVESLDLERLDVRRARRVLVLGPAGREPDSEVISAILATRRLNPRVDVFAALEHEKNFLAAREAGGRGTHLVGAGSFLGYYLAKNVLFPGIDATFRQLLTSAGCEMYTYLLAPEERERLRARPPADARALWERAFDDWGVHLAGFLVGSADGSPVEAEGLEVILDPADPAGRPGFDARGDVVPARIHGLVGVCLRWDQIRRMGRDLAAGKLSADEPARGAAAVPDLRLVAPAAPRRVLVCGDSRRVPRLCQLLLEAEPEAQIVVLTRSASTVPLAREVESALRGYLAGIPRLVEERPLEVEREERRSRLRRPEGGEVRILRADWTDGRRLLFDPEIALGSVDVALFLPQRQELEEPDGQVALDCLRIAHVAGERLVDLAPSLRVIGMVADPVKGDLLEERLDRLSLDRGGADFTVLATERLRNHFIVQNLFVPALNAIYLELLGVGSRSIGRWAPELEREAVSARDLAHELWRRGMVLIGLEIAGDGGTNEPEVVLDPWELVRRGAIPADRIRAVLGIGRPG